MSTSAESPAVSILTDATDGGDLEATATALLGQSLRDWSWTIVTRSESDVSLPADPRIRRARATSRAQGLVEALAGRSPYVAIVEPGDVPGPTALEKWVWYLDARPEVDLVTSLDAAPAPTPGLMRRAAFDRAGTFDAARSAARRVARIAVPKRSGEHDGAYSAGDDEHLPNAWLPEGAPLENAWQTTSRRLLVIGTWMSVGGADKLLLDLLDQLGARGWDATIATTVSSKHDWLPAYAARTSDLFPLEQFLRLVDYPRFLAYLIKSRKPDAVLVTNSEFGYRVLPYLRTECPDTAFLDFCHSEAEHWNYGGYPRFSVEYGAFLDLTVTVSEHLRRWMTQRGGEPARIEVSHANVDTELIQPDAARRLSVRRALGLGEDEPIVLFGGRVSEDKQPRVIAGTLARLARMGVRFTAVIAGDGPDLPWLRKAVARFGLDGRVLFVGAIPHSDLIELVQAADVFFLPSRSEGIALTLYEAMACGVPVVGAAVGGQAELVTGDSGILVRRTSASEESVAYATALAEILSDDELRKTMGAAARTRVVERFDLRQTGPRMTELIDRAIELHASEPRAALPKKAAGAWATEAVELTRLARFSDWIWWERDRTNRPGLRGYSTRAYFALRQAGGPLYRHGLEQQWAFLPRTKRIVERLLVGGR